MALQHSLFLSILVLNPGAVTPLVCFVWVGVNGGLEFCVNNAKYIKVLYYVST